jgi:hypothetical protein
MHSSYFSTNDYLLDQAVGKYWTNRADAIEARKASEAKEKEEAIDNSFELTEEESYRFNSKVIRGEGDNCDTWVAGKFPEGYGKFKLRGKSKPAHIVSWQQEHGRLANPSTKMVIAHICEVKACVKPSHLDEQTQQQNMLYANDSIPATQRAKTHCPKGHVLIEENCRPDRWARGERCCRACDRAMSRKKFALTKAAREALGITDLEYIRLYGQGQAAALAIIADPHCAPHHRKK